MRKENVVNNKGLSSRKSFVRDLPSAKSLLNKEKQPYCMKQAEDPGQQPAGTTTFFYNGGFTPALVIPVLAIRADAGYSAGYKSGFTLIELLVVVLIIGILAAVALPQYKKIVWKSRAAQIIPVVRALAEAEKRYFLANGTYATNFDELDLKFTQSTGYEEKKSYWTLHIHNIRSSQRVFAEINRFGNPWFYISYDLANNWLECMPEGDGGKDICKLFSKTEPYSCTGATYETYKCYRI